jgi:hypothetical protein
VPIQFSCPACNRRLSIATRKAGTSLACPNCKAAITVPSASTPVAPPAPAAVAPATVAPRAVTPTAPNEEPEFEPAHNLRSLLVAACVALVLFGGLALALTLALRKPAERAAEQARLESPTSTPVPTTPVPQQQPTEKPQPKALPQAQQPYQPQPQPPVDSQAGGPPVSASQPTAPSPPPQPQAPAEAPAPQVVVKPPAPPPPLDKFGNPVGPTVGLGQDGEFKGKKILFWCAYENAGRVFFHPTNPLWKALQAKGFVVTPVFGKFNPAWLKETDQLWIVSSGQFEVPGGLTPDLYLGAVDLLPPELVPSGFTVQEYKFIVQATFDVAFSPRHVLDEKAFKAIEEFAKSGKGLCLLADDEPFTSEADELARRLFGARVRGNYIGDKVATVRGRGLTAAEIRKFGGQFEVDDHALLTGVNFLFEGITISNVSKSDKLEVAMKASDGQALLAVSKVPGQRVVIDCGFSRYLHGPTERTSYIHKTPGPVRLAQNIAAYLAGKDAPKKPE